MSKITFGGLCQYWSQRNTVYRSVAGDESCWWTCLIIAANFDCWSKGLQVPRSLGQAVGEFRLCGKPVRLCHDIQQQPIATQHLQTCTGHVL